MHITGLGMMHSILLSVTHMIDSFTKSVRCPRVGRCVKIGSCSSAWSESQWTGQYCWDILLSQNQDAIKHTVYDNSVF